MYPPSTASSNHQTGPSQALTFKLIILGMTVSEPHETAVLIRLVDVGAVDSMEAKTYDIASFGGNRD